MKNFVWLEYRCFWLVYDELRVLKEKFAYEENKQRQQRRAEERVWGRSQESRREWQRRYRETEASLILMKCIRIMSNSFLHCILGFEPRVQKTCNKRHSLFYVFFNHLNLETKHFLRMSLSEQLVQRNRKNNLLFVFHFLSKILFCF